jgi:hypothetical protein
MSLKLKIYNIHPFARRESNKLRKPLKEYREKADHRPHPGFPERILVGMILFLAVTYEINVKQNRYIIFELACFYFQRCPARYPWLGNARGRDTDVRDTYPKPE